MMKRKDYIKMSKILFRDQAASLALNNYGGCEDS